MRDFLGVYGECEFGEGSGCYGFKSDFDGVGQSFQAGDVYIHGIGLVIRKER